MNILTVLISHIPFLLLILPVLGIAVVAVLRKTRVILWVMVFFSLLSTSAALAASLGVMRDGVILAAEGMLRIDSFSAWHLVLLTLTVFTPASLFSVSYLGGESPLPVREARHFGMLWLGCLLSMSLTLESGNIGLIWVGIEASTLCTAFLILRKNNPASLEAMWKYIIMCSVGVAFAFIGTLFITAAAQQAGLRGNDSLLLDEIYRVRGLLNPSLVIPGFVFILVGYGTKAGLSPMHNWLPDAHSQAPAPVSAMFSGFLLNTALYCILRFLPLADAVSSKPDGPMRLFMFFGLLSITLAAAFIPFQRDAKRMLAYCSVEHIGIIAFGYALGPVGTAGALFHTLNHSLAKTVGFYSSGALGKHLRTYHLASMDGALRRYRLWGLGLFGSILALIGLAPTAVFMSELQLIRAAVDSRAYLPLALFLLSTVTVFMVMLNHAIHLAWKPAPGGSRAGMRTGWTDRLVVILPLSVLLVLGIWMPPVMRNFIEGASAALWRMP